MIEVFWTKIPEKIFWGNASKGINIIRKRKKMQTLFGRCLLYYALKKIYDIEEEIIIAVNYFGKPYLKNNNTIFFSISHSYNYIACVISDMDIGIDIQTILHWEDNKTMSIANNFFSDKESQTLKNVKNKNELFSEIWTLKESYIKFKGEGLKLPLANIEFEIVNSNLDVKFHNKDDSRDTAYFRLTNINEICKMAFCTVKKDSYNIRKIEYQELQEIINK